MLKKLKKIISKNHFDGKASIVWMRPYVHTVLILDQVCTNYDPQGLDGDTKEEVRILKVEQGVTC